MNYGDSPHQVNQGMFWAKGGSGGGSGIVKDNTIIVNLIIVADTQTAEQIVEGFKPNLLQRIANALTGRKDDYATLLQDHEGNFHFHNGGATERTRQGRLAANRGDSGKR